VETKEYTTASGGRKGAGSPEARAADVAGTGRHCFRKLNLDGDGVLSAREGRRVLERSCHVCSGAA
jgi:hypothetical protein